MANDIQQRQQVRRFTWVNPAGQGLGPAGMTADEVKANLTVRAANNPALAPIAQKGPVEFISPTTSSESLRLAVPAGANRLRGLAPPGDGPERPRGHLEG
jgi:hypothetical protein